MAQTFSLHNTLQRTTDKDKHEKQMSEELSSFASQSGLGMMEYLTEGDAVNCSSVERQVHISLQIVLFNVDKDNFAPRRIKRRASSM